MQTKNLADIELYIEKTINVIKNNDLSKEQKTQYITRILNIYLKENVDYVKAVEKICDRIKAAKVLYEARMGDWGHERKLKNALREYLFDLVKVRGFIRGTRYHVFIKEKQTICKKLIFKNGKGKIPQKYLKPDWTIDYRSIKEMLEVKGEQDWVKFDPDYLYSLWITKPGYQYTPYKYR